MRSQDLYSVIDGEGLHSGIHNIIYLTTGKEQGINFYYHCEATQEHEEFNIRDCKVVNTIGSLDIAYKDIRINTIEHLLGALHFHGIDSITIEITDKVTEIPILNGSISGYIEDDLNIRDVLGPSKYIIILKDVTINMDNQMAKLSAHHRFIIDYTFMGHRYHETIGDNAVLNAKTFVNVDDIPSLIKSGRCLGGSGSNNTNIVDFKNNKILSPGKYNEDIIQELLYHKVADALGDLYITGYPIIGKYTANNSNHTINAMLMQELMSDSSNYKIVEED